MATVTEAPFRDKRPTNKTDGNGIITRIDIARGQLPLKFVGRVVDISLPILHTCCTNLTSKPCIMNVSFPNIRSDRVLGTKAIPPNRNFLERRESLSCLREQRANLTQTSLLHRAVEASHIGKPPGAWPFWVFAVSAGGL